ncbi:hypothetical protein BA763_25345 [Burkholderia cenocepacia]|nr:hypothetical protein BA763_25345 [Burkholderia cenocepacia]
MIAATTAIALVILPLAALPVAAAVPVAVAMPADDDRRRRGDHDGRGATTTGAGVPMLTSTLTA